MASAVEQALQDSDVKKRLLNKGLYPNYQGPAEFAEQIKVSQEAFHKVLTNLGMIQQ